MNRLTRKDESGRYYVDSKDIGFYSTSRDENGRCTFGGEHVDKLAKYEDLGTIEELQQAIEKQTAVSRIIIEGQYFCPKCKNLMKYPGYCGCGQKVY